MKQKERLKQLFGALMNHTTQEVKILNKRIMAHKTGSKDLKKLQFYKKYFSAW